MEVQSQQIQHGCHSGPISRAQSADSEVMQEIRFLDQVLDAASDATTNGVASPTECRPVSADGGCAQVSGSAPLPAAWQQSTPVHQDESVVRTNGHAETDESGHDRPKFELRAFHEEKRPAKLFSPGEEQQVRVTRRRPSEEVQELERERQELIRGQAVKKNPGIAQRWWNPPQEVPLEEQLQAEQLESLRKYQERKQQKHHHPHTYSQPQISGPPSVVTFDPMLTRKEDVLEEQIDFSSARKQFLQEEAAKRGGASHALSSKPPWKPTSGSCSSDVVTETGESHVTWSDEGAPVEFTCARAVMTILREGEDSGGRFQPDESDSGLEELSLRSQDTTPFSLDSVSDSGASLPPTPLPLTPVSPPTPQPTTPVNGRVSASPTEDELEFQAGVLVQNAIQSALGAQNGGQWQPPQYNSSQLSAPVSPSSASTGSPVPVSSSPVSSGGVCSFHSSMSCSPAPVSVSPQRDAQSPQEDKLPGPCSPAQQPQLLTPSPPSSQPVSPPQRARNGGPRIKIQSSYTRALAFSDPAPPPAPEAAPVSRPTPVCRPPSPPSPEKPEFSYFSKYSEAAELRSTAASSRGPEAEPASGPFRLRSKKKKTFSMIEEEIRAAQQREEELKRQRETQPAVSPRPSSTSSSLLRPAARSSSMSTVERMKSNSLPTRLTLTAKTAPGKIEKVRPAPPVSPSPSEGTLSDAGSEDSVGSRPKNFMQTLMEDYETHKGKRRDKSDDNSVLEATRMTRRKNNMALKWEAGIYANEKEAGGEEEDGEEEEEEE